MVRSASSLSAHVRLMPHSAIDSPTVSVPADELVQALRQGTSRSATAPGGDGIAVDEVIRELSVAGDDSHAPQRDCLNPRVVDLRDQGHAPLKVSACPVCDHRIGAPMFGIDGLPHRVLQCMGCGLGRLDPLPSPTELAEFYPADYYGSPGAKFEPFTEAVVRFVGTVHVQCLSRTLPPNARILDVGCGRGVLLSALADRGHEVHGMDVSATAVAGADPRARIKVAGCLTECDYPDDAFDQVILWHVLEHLPNPREVLTEIRRILKPGGQLIVAVPNFSSLQSRWAGPAWFHLDLPRHLFHFPVSGLRQLLDRTGFTVAREQHFSLRQNPFGWVQSALNRHPNLRRNALYNMLHNRSADQVVPEPLQRLALRAGYLAGMPLALGISLWATLMRSGASVCLVGRKTPAESD